MSVPLIVAFVNTQPVAKGICTRCAGDKRIVMQCMGGEVRDQTCSRCLGSGKEPTTLFAKICANLRTETYP
jgi:hypothetical protein